MFNLQYCACYILVVWIKEEKLHLFSDTHVCVCVSVLSKRLNNFSNFVITQWAFFFVFSVVIATFARRTFGCGLWVAFKTARIQKHARNGTLFLNIWLCVANTASLIRTSEQARRIPWRANALGRFYRGNSISSRRNIQSIPFVPFNPLVPFIIHLIVSAPT